MQKKLIAVAIAGLMSSVAFAQSSVTVSGRADAGYMFKKNATTTSEAQVDGNHGTTEVWIRGKETVNKFLEVGADLNMRYGGGLHESKSGMSSNDRKSMYVKFPFATVQFGTANLASGEYKLSTKPYAGNLGEWEGVKWSISQVGESQLTNRNTTFWTDPDLLKFGPVAVLFKGTFAGGDARKAGTPNIGNGDVVVAGAEFSLFNKAVTGGYDVSSRSAASGENSLVWRHAYVSGNAIPKTLKLGAAYNTYQGDTSAAASFKVKTMSFHVNYVVTPSFEVGATYALLNAKHPGTQKANGYMIGGNYFLSKTAILYAGFAKQNAADGLTTGNLGIKYDGTAAGFGTSQFSVADEQSIRFGIRKNF